jgi:hypothetical protein
VGENAQCSGLRAQGKSIFTQDSANYLSDRRKLVIFLLNIISLRYIVDFSEEVIIFLLSKICKIFAHSKIDLLEMFRKLAKSLSEKDPEPSCPVKYTSFLKDSNISRLLLNSNL